MRGWEVRVCPGPEWESLVCPRPHDWTAFDYERFGSVPETTEELYRLAEKLYRRAASNVADGVCPACLTVRLERGRCPCCEAVYEACGTAEVIQSFVLVEFGRLRSIDDIEVVT